MQKADCVIEIPGFWGGMRRVTFSIDGLHIEKVNSFDNPEFISTEEIAAFRYEARRLKGYKFPVGTQFSIDIQSFSGKVTTFKLKSFYGIKRKRYEELWNDMLQQLWEYYFVNLLNYYRELKNVGQYFELAGVQFHNYGISWENEISMFWHEIGMANYRTYFMIYRIGFNKHRKSCSFANDWNAIVLQSLLKEIIGEEKKLKKSI